MQSQNGSLAQLVQSICLTSRGSGVRIPQLPLIIERQRRINNPSLFCASCCVKTSFPHHSHKIRFTPFRCRPIRSSVILCERGCRAIICLFSKVALRRLRRSNPSTPTAKQNIASKPLGRVAFVVYAGQGKLVFNLSRIYNKVGRTMYDFDSNVLLPLGVEGTTSGAQRSEVNPSTDNKGL